ncbi:MAG: hypothetical protein JWM28_2149 [Chitinophagaceae bacterium]|nr:hypothetical protein [Chitinophagaceae bacterium]
MIKLKNGLIPPLGVINIDYNLFFQIYPIHQSKISNF